MTRSLKDHDLHIDNEYHMSTPICYSFSDAISE